MTSLARQQTSPNRAHLSVVDNRSFSTDDSVPDTPAVAGVEDDFVLTYELHYPRLIRALEFGGASRQSAEDLAQEAFARTLDHWRRVRRGSNPAGYVYRVAFRLARRRSDSDVYLGDEASSSDVAGEATLIAGIDKALNVMPMARRRCAVLCLIVGMSTKEAARTLRIAESTVRKQIERARSDLRSALDESG